MEITKETKATKGGDKSKKRLGRGLSSLLSTNVEKTDPVRQKLLKDNPKEEKPAEVLESKSIPKTLKLPIERVVPNPDQPRTKFDKSQLQQLADSIKEKGIIQPIVVQPMDERNYKIVAGERRWRASQLAGLHEVPVVVRDYLNDEDTLELALIENVQREDLNPIEEAKAYKRLQEKFSYTQAKISKKIGKDRATVANSIRLLSLHPEIQKMVVEKKITVGHAKALLSVENQERQLAIAKKIINEKLNVRRTESLAQEKEVSATEADPDISEKLVAGIAEDLQRLLSRKVKIDYKNKKGKIVLHFYSDDELSELVESIKRGWKRPHGT